MENKLNKTIEEEFNFISLTEAVLKDNIAVEMLNKIRFFLTNGYINPNSYLVDINKEIFYNMETNQSYQVIKDNTHNRYEIKEFTTPSKEINNNLNMTQHKVRVLKKETPPHMGNAAFTKIGLLAINIISFILFIAMAILLRK